MNNPKNDHLIRSMNLTAPLMDNISKTTNMIEYASISSNLMVNFRKSMELIENANSSSRLMDSFRKSMETIENATSSTSLMDNLRRNIGMIGYANSSSRLMDSFRKSMETLENTTSSISIMDNLRRNIGMIEYANSSSKLIDSIRKSMEDINSIRDITSLPTDKLIQAAIELPNLSVPANQVLNQFRVKELNLKETIGALSDLNNSIENSIQDTPDNSITEENNIFIEYWITLYQNILQHYKVLDSSILAKMLRDVIMIISFAITVQGNSSPGNPEINIHNYSDSNIEVKTSEEDINIKITTPDEIDSLKKIIKDDILNPGIQS